MADVAKTIGFKLSGENLERLEKVASNAGMTVHEFARDALIAKLTAKDEEERALHKMSMRLLSIEAAVVEVRKDIAVSTEALLINGGVSTADAARWTDEKLRAA
jgi:hypothetical protein